jgi:Tfp pilus assembly PilM family ATPase
MNLLAWLHDAPPPAVAVEMAATHIAGAALDWRGRRPVVAAHASEPLAPGALVPSLTAANVIDRAAVAAALGRVLGQLGRPRRIGLVVPDLVAKVSIVRFEQVPPRAQDLDRLVRWQVRKSAPFAVEDAQVGWVAGQRAADGAEFIVSVARREAVEEYEGLAAGAGAHAGLVDLSSFGVINAVLARRPAPATAGDWLLVHVAPGYATLAILRGPHLVFFRNRAADSEGTLGDLVHQTAMYYQDRLKGTGFARVLLAGGHGSDLRRGLEERLAAPVETVDPLAAATLTDRIAAAPALVETLTPLVGLLVRGRGREAAA